MHKGSPTQKNTNPRTTENTRPYTRRERLNPVCKTRHTLTLAITRSTTDLLNIVQEIRDKGAQLRFIDNPSLNTDTAQGAFMLTVLGAVAELERATIRERQAEGIALAKERGVYSKQRSPKLSPANIRKAQDLVAQGVAKTRIARDLGVSRTTLHHALTGTGRYQHPVTEEQ